MNHVLTEDSVYFANQVTAHERVLVLTGAGCSTGSGIPDYRDRSRAWKRPPPMHIPEFLSSEEARKRYWARSMVGWKTFSRARPNAVHHGLAALERAQWISCLVTQNVDGLHQRAGSVHVIDLHGRLQDVVCLDCRQKTLRSEVQEQLEALNSNWHYAHTTIAPDGDVDLEGADYTQFELAHCKLCGGRLKPDVVFFGENVPRTRVSTAMSELEQADALMIIGSSLSVFSGYRFVRAALKFGQPVYIVNDGETRADDDATLKISGDAGQVIDQLQINLGIQP
ncbi:MAG: NAD-dependent protein deacetylase [Gammaproteobacteria bacterium]